MFAICSFPGAGGCIPLRQVKVERYTLEYGSGLSCGPVDDDRGEPVMPRIRDEMLDCVIYLYRSPEEAELGEGIGGSGFALSIPCERVPQPSRHVYAVTNKHVIESGAIHVRLNTKDGRMIIMKARRKDWMLSDKDDLAVCALGALPASVSMNAIPWERLITKEMIQQYDIGIGDDVVMFGRFINRDGLQQNAPTARFGHISQMPGDPIETQEEAFLCEVRSIGGYSGSPVFLLHNPLYLHFPTDKGIVLGVDFCHILNWTSAQDNRGQELPHIRLPLNSGMAGVIPAWRLQELIMSEKPVAQRKMAEESEIQRRNEPKAIVDSAIPPANDANPKHREDFTRLLGAAARTREPKD
jgi:hypothetical protein